jgi:serine/arginine repetitive matrix protein 1
MDSRGISFQQDPFFRNKQKKLYASRSFPPEFSQKVDMTRVSLDALRPWIEKRVTEFLGDEDEIVNEYCIAQLEAYDPVDRSVEPRDVQINLEGFLGESSAAIFMKELWSLLLSAQHSSAGVPEELIEQQKRDKEEKDRAAEKLRLELERTREAERMEKERNILRRERERREDDQRRPQRRRSRSSSRDRGRRSHRDRSHSRDRGRDYRNRR